ncbi:zincin [Coccomyxa subellipsoidea C-169]|uniref:Zincin n=1 Tax=Coccomyxa subellipsoidea (strain C-169) TaxID=574566 RepID=I0YYM4_COCSC|nr:zincin [Coccomyxa subellipsoidea C-169]EIE23493.1 zincin [Coccomyxa subellipsoidea C-169]|eukprot:XP_005648037.1 zincin [Coccomyxa subellipsoidea C-169]
MRVIARSDDLINQAVLSSTPLDTIRALDDISDTICQAYDTAEFCRNVHSCPEWQEAATQACIVLGAQVEKLNTNESLYGALVRALDCHEQTAAHSAPASEYEQRPGLLTAEALRVGRSLRHDMEKAGIHLPHDKRSRLTELVGQERCLGMAIGQNLTDVSKLGHVDLDINGEGGVLLQSRMNSLAPSRSGRRVSLGSHALSGLLQWEHSAKNRQKAYVAGYCSPRENLALLEQLLGARQEMAALVGARSYAHHNLRDATLAGSPEAVHSFLLDLAAAIQPKVEEEVELLRRYKAKHLGKAVADVQLDAWDRLYYMAMAKAEEYPLDQLEVAAYFHLQHCIDGFGQLLKTLMGVSLTKVPLAPGEAWADNIQKLTLVHEDEGPLGTIYLDLQPRRGKVAGASHFTLRCGRRLVDGSYQAPIVAVVCSFAVSSGGLLSPDQAQTLFHEFGHALHSLLSRTHFQHHSGTRGPMDLMEVPSHVTEHFARSPHSLRAFMHHHISGRPMPAPLVQRLRASQRLFEAINLQQQVVDALIDQRLHGPRSMGGASSSDIVSEVMQEHSVFPFVPGTFPQARFHHLVGYGATYYSYLYAQALSSAIWQQHFANGQINRSSGDHIRRTMLQCGSAREPAHYVHGMLGDSHLVPVNGGFKPEISSLLKDLGLE